MKIAIIGSGSVGSALGKAWARAGHQITYAVRDPAAAKVRKLLSELGPPAKATEIGAAAGQCEVIVLTTPWGEPARQAIEACGNLGGKVVLDCTNPLKADLSGLTVGFSSSAGEQVAEWAAGARVVKIFNTTGANNMENSDYGGQAPTMFYAGDDPGAKAVAKQLSAEIGFEPCDAGPLSQARLLEPLALLWISMAYSQGYGREIAFKLLRR
jgi:hypothetical protein